MRAHGVSGLLIGLLLLACTESQENGKTASGAATIARASLLLEPPTIGIGDVTTAVILVTTPPGHRVLPVAVAEVPGVWILESLVDPTEKSATRWLHRTRVRLRPRETGTFSFPQSQLTIESESGEQRVLLLASREFEVVSILPSFPDRTAPFGLQELTANATSVGLLWPTVAATLAALVAILTGMLWRRRGQDALSPEEAPVSAPPPTLPEWSQRQLAQAFEALEREPREAANAGARFLRHYVDSRFHTHTSASTTEELAALKPPLAAHFYWADFVDALQSLDELRWRPLANNRDDSAQRVRSALESAQRFLEASSPRGVGS